MTEKDQEQFFTMFPTLKRKELIITSTPLGNNVWYDLFEKKIILKISLEEYE